MSVRHAHPMPVPGSQLAPAGSPDRPGRTPPHPAGWDLTRCHECRAWRATRKALAALPTGTELTVATAGPLLVRATTGWGDEVSVLKGVLPMQGQHAAGAAAILWGCRTHPAPRRPGPTLGLLCLAANAPQLTEAEGCGTPSA